MKYFIWSFEHRAWWKADWRGYSTNFDEAGKYTQEEALKICSQANYSLASGLINESMIPITV